MKPIKIKRGMVFGVFDGLHPGHEFFLTAAARNCGELVVVVTTSEAAALLKGRIPRQDISERIAAIKSYGQDFIVVAGDAVPGSWKVLKDHSPDVIFLGYDQHGIARELDRLGFAYRFVESFKPEVYKSSLIRI